MVLSRIRSTRLAVGACLGAGALAVAGCGGSSSSASSGPTTTTTPYTSATLSAGVTATRGGHTASAGASAGAPATSGSNGRKSAKQLPAAVRSFLLGLLPYAQSWQSASQSFNAAVRSAGSDLSKIASASGAYAQQTKRFADGLAHLHAPPKESAEQKALISRIRRLDGDVAALQSAASHGNAAQAQAAERNVRKDSGAVSASVLKLAHTLTAGALGG